MSVRAPLAVRIDDGVTDRHVTGEVSDLRWKKSARGGFISASFTLRLDPATFSDLGAADKVYIYGPTSAIPLWEGYLDYPGDVDGADGVALDVTCTGTAVLGSDQARQLVYIDRDLGAWEPYAKNTATSNATASDDPTDIDPDPGLLTQFNQGTVAAANARSQIGYSRLREIGMELGAFRATYKSGKSDANYVLELAYAGAGIGSGDAALETSVVTGSRARGLYVGASGSFPAGTTAVALRMRRRGDAGATNVADDNTWTWFDNVAAVARRMDRTGTLLSGSAGMVSFDSVLASQVVEDMLGRLLFGIVDRSSSTVEPTTFAIDQLAFTDPTTFNGVVEELQRVEPDLVSEFLHSTAAGVVYNLRAWPTDVRYEVSTQGGFSQPGGDYELCNRISVYWVDVKGKDRTTVVTAASEAGVTLPGGGNPAPTVFSGDLRGLEDQGRVRDAEAVTLPAGRGSAANAQRIGQQFLAAAATPPKAARLVVDQPVRDLYTGAWAMPYELETGYPVRVLETSDVLRLTELDYDDAREEAVLQLGTPMLTREQRLAQLAKAVKWMRR